MYTSSHPTGYDPEPPQHNYWWELTNFGLFDINLNGYSWDDNSNIPGQFVFPDITIRGGESVIVLEKYNSNETPDITGFISEWNFDCDNNVNEIQILTSESFNVPYLPGFGSGGLLYLYDPSNNVIDATPALDTIIGTSRHFLFDGSSFDSVHGQFGAWQAVMGDIGSPGVIPEPATVTLLTLGGLVLIRKRK